MLLQRLLPFAALVGTGAFVLSVAGDVPGTAALAAKQRMPAAIATPGSPQDVALKDLRRKAAQGDADAQFKLGYAYSHGEGVAYDEEQAVAWFRRAAEQGNAKAQYFTGVMYASTNLRWQSVTQAARWYRKAAEQGVEGAQYELGMMLTNGQGVEQNDCEAYVWLSIVATHPSDDPGPRGAHLVREDIARRLTPLQLEEAQRRVRNWIAVFEKRKK